MRGFYSGDESMKNFLAMYIFFFVGAFPLFSYPGDHNGLTCTKLATVKGVTDDKGNYPYKGAYWYTALKGQNLISNCDSGTLCEALSIKVTGDIDVTEEERRANALAYIESNREAIEGQIRNHHDASIDVAVLGDSLSDFVNLYGARKADFFPDRRFNGYYGGFPDVIDSFDDYVNNVYPFVDPVSFANYGVAGATTSTILKMFRVRTFYDQEIYWYNASEDADHCQIQGENKAAITGAKILYFNSQHRSPLRSMMMIGGNDVLNAMQTDSLLPYLTIELTDHVLANISMIADWHAVIS